MVILIAPGSACSGSAGHTPEVGDSRPGSKGDNTPAPLIPAKPPGRPAYPKLDALLNQLLAQRGQRPDADAVRSFLETIGATIAHSADGVVEAYVPLSLLPGLQGRQEVVRVEAVVPPQPSAQRSAPP